MDASHEQHDGGSYWSFANNLLALGFGSFAFISSASLLYRGVFPAETPKPEAMSAAPAAAPAASTNPNDVVIKTDPVNPLAYNIKGFTVKAGKKVKVTFSNESAVPLQHNFILCKSGTDNKVQALAMAMLADPQGLAKSYVPDSPDIIAHTKLVNQKESATIEFDAPAPGEYPYFCSFPGHSAIMNGKMKVE